MLRVRTSVFTNYAVERPDFPAGHSVNDGERLSIDNNLGGNADFNSSLMALAIGDFFML